MRFERKTVSWKDTMCRTLPYTAFKTTFSDSDNAAAFRRSPQQSHSYGTAISLQQLLDASTMKAL